jgi:DNA/RNA endonuclease G (NUC1)
MLTRLVRGRRPLVWLAVVLAACSADRIGAPTMSPNGEASHLVTTSPAQVVISQIYGGGGNSGATFKNDFIELHNRTSHDIVVDGWSVQYASATGVNWAVTPLSGKIPAGAYYLVHESAGAGGTVDLPAADASGSILMSATAGKVALSMSTTPLGTTAVPVACPTTEAIDLVSFGSGTSDCGFGRTAPVSNTNAAIRKDAGCTYTGAAGSDFQIALPAPRNSSYNPKRVCEDVLPPSIGPLDHVTIGGATAVTAGSTITLTASAEDAENDRITGATFTWSSSDETIATVTNAGVVRGVLIGGPVTVTATTTVGGITKSGTQQVTVQIPTGSTSINISGRSPTDDAPLPVGFQDQLFATKTGTTVTSWESLTPAIATIDARGVFTSKAAGSATFKVTMSDGTFRTTTLPMHVAKFGNASLYGNNVLLGAPSAGGSDNDLIVTRAQYTLSYNKSRGGPNWVAYRLTRENRGNLPGYRCDCFTPDPAVTPAGEAGISTADYTNSGFDRGHMVRSNDRELDSLDQAQTYYTSNILPQWGNQNQGRWADLENYLQTVEEGAGNPEVYIIAGGRGEASRIAGGRIAVPTHTWKVALVLKNGATLASIDDPSDIVDVIAVDMPNVQNSPRDGNWQASRVTVDSVEKATGYDVLALLNDYVENIVESGDRRPTASYTGTTSANEGATLNFTSTSTDADVAAGKLGDALSYQWSINGAAKGITPEITATFPHDGSYVVQLIVSDIFGWADTATKTVTIANVAPAITAFSGATILEGERYSASGSFTDPGDDTWSATVNYGDGSGEQALALSGKSFTLGHDYASDGSYTVTVKVNDGTATTARTATVVVQTAAEGVSHLADMLGTLSSLSNGERNSLRVKLAAAERKLARMEDKLEGKELLRSFVNELEAMVNSGRLAADAAAPLIAYAERVSASAGR